MKTALENTKNLAGSDSPPIPANHTPPAASAGAGASMPNVEEMMRNMGGGGGAGGMPDLASMMNNPMMRQMADSLMANGGMERLMQNPAVANMVMIVYFWLRKVHAKYDAIDESSELWRRDAEHVRADVRP